MPLDTHARDALIDLAARQAGLFTTHQAVELGYSHQAQQTHIRSGSWDRIHRGIYRLAALPPADHEAFAFYHLWSGGAAAVSHESALGFYNIGHLEPEGAHISLPADFHRTLNLPDVLSARDVVGASGFRVTTALRAILDVASAGLGGDHLAQVIGDGLAQDVDMDGLWRRAQTALEPTPRQVLGTAIADAFARRQHRNPGVAIGD